MKTLLTLSILLLSFTALFGQSDAGRVFKINTADIPPNLPSETDAKLGSRSMDRNFGKVKVADFLQYLNNNSSFNHLLITYSVRGANKLYFTARAVNRPTPGTQLSEADKAIEEFVSLRGNVERPDQGNKQNFNGKKGPDFNPEGFYLSTQSVKTMLEEFQANNERNVQVEGLLTREANQDYLNLVFKAEASAMTYSTFDISASRLAPDTGCPPFNCN